MKKFLGLIIAISMLSVTVNISADEITGQSYTIKGDINQDGIFNLSDVTLFQRWLFNETDTEVSEQKDFSKDGRINILDFTLMKNELLNPEMVEITSPYCKASAFVCIDDKELIYYNNIDEKIAPASLTKLLTASVALHYLSPDTIITVGSEQKLVKSGSSLCLIKSGHRLKLYDLLTGMLMASGNDAAYTVAVATARAVNPNVQMTDVQAVECFAELMNEYASSIGMKNSHFINPEGWDNVNQYTTVSDLIILADYAFSVPEIREITSTYQKYVVFASGENITWKNTNALLNPTSSYYCINASGMKTGTTNNAGNCLISVFEKNKKTYISVVMGCNSNADRYNLALKLFSNYSDF